MKKKGKPRRKACGCKFGQRCRMVCLRKLNERKQRKQGQKAYGRWDCRSDAMAVFPSQVGEAMAVDKKNGAPATEYKVTGDGYAAQPVFTSWAHQKAWCKANKKANWDSYM